MLTTKLELIGAMVQLARTIFPYTTKTTLANSMGHKTVICDYDISRPLAMRRLKPTS
jgi:hypothetical protein